MRILIFGAGVIGHIYGARLEDAGHDVRLYVRPEKLERFPNGVNLRLFDTRQAIETHRTYLPRLVTEFGPRDAYDLILVSVTRTQLGAALPVLAANAGAADILFFQNNWTGTIEIDPYLPREQFLFGFPQAGGSFDEEGINGAIKPQVMLGEADGERSERLERIAQMFRSARFHPIFTNRILGWLWTHYAAVAALIGPAARAHGFEAFTRDDALIKEAIFAGREAVEVVQARGVDTHGFADAQAVHLPTWIGVPMFKMSMHGTVARRTLGPHWHHAYEEMARIYRDVVQTGRALEIPMPHLESFEVDIAAMEREGAAFARAHAPQTQAEAQAPHLQI